MKHMRIAVIAPPWTPVPPDLYGGIELVVDRLAQGFQAAGHEVLLFTTGDSTCPVPKQWLLEQSQGHRIGMALPEMNHVMAAYDAVRDFDIIHDHTLMGPPYSRLVPGLTVVTTVHGNFDSDLAALYERVSPHVATIAISHAQRRPAPHIPIARVIHHGLDVSEFPIGSGDGGYCLFLGRMSPDKGAHRAIEACKKAGVPLIMAAKMREPAEQLYFDQQVRPHLSDEVQYLGEVPHAEKLDLLARAKALVFPIRWNEPFGMVMIEAMACGTPVLAFPEGAAPEVVEDGKTGFLCHDESDMAEAITRVDSIERNACRAAVEGYFSTTRMVDEHLSLFSTLLGV